ncbi:MAG: MFS transporter [Planctomycetota bacterium]
MRVALFYFVFISTTGLVLPYFPKYLDALGFTKTQIGCVNTIGPVMLTFVPLLWGFIADKTGRTALLLKIASAGVAVTLATFALADIRTYVGVLCVWFVYSFFQSTQLPLADSLALVEARRIGTDYARLRLWGSISFILVSFGFGQYLQHGGDITWVPKLAAGLAVCAALCAHLLRQYGTGPARVPPTFRDAGKLFHDPSLMWFFAAGLIHQAALSPYYLFYNLHLSNLGLGQDIVGWSFALGVGAEVAMFWFARPLFKHKPLFPLMAVSFLMSSARWLAVAYVTNGPLMACIQIAHAFTFALCYAGSIAHLEKNIREPLRATGRAMFSAISLGLGSIVGYIPAGKICDAFGIGASFKAAAVLDVLALIPLFIAAHYARLKDRAEETLDDNEPFKDVPPPVTGEA